jgi:hypothetical protein
VHQARPTQQQASLTPSANPLGSSNSPVRGVTDSEIRFGISAPFSGPAKELGQNMKLASRPPSMWPMLMVGCTAASSD